MKQFYTFWDLPQRNFYLIFWTLVWRFATAPLLTYFLDPSIHKIVGGDLSQSLERSPQFARRPQSPALERVEWAKSYLQDLFLPSADFTHQRVFGQPQFRHENS